MRISCNGLPQGPPQVRPASASVPNQPHPQQRKVVSPRAVAVCARTLTASRRLRARIAAVRSRYPPCVSASARDVWLYRALLRCAPVRPASRAAGDCVREIIKSAYEVKIYGGAQDGDGDDPADEAAAAAHDSLCSPLFLGQVGQALQPITVT
jgi:hypothetical protein